MKRYLYIIALTTILIVNALLRFIYALYGYIPTEEGIILYHQKLAYQGLLPFIDFYAWNSLLNSYLIGWVQHIIPLTIFSQRITGLIIALIVAIIASTITKKVSHHASLLTALIITFCSFTYLYYSTAPLSEQTMTLALIGSAWFFMQAINSKKRILYQIGGLCCAVLAIPIRAQAIPAVFILWIYILFVHRKNIKIAAYISAFAAAFIILVYLPFLIRNVDQTLYSILWPLNAQNIIVFSHGMGRWNPQLLMRFFIEMFHEYGPVLIIMGTIVVIKLSSIKKLYKSIFLNPIATYMFFITISACALAATSLLHQPPYVSYIYPSIPLFAIAGGYYLWSFTYQKKLASVLFMYSFVLFTSLYHLVTFPHLDYMKTSLATIHQTPYSLLTEILHYVEEKTSLNSEILTFYLPAVAELPRRIPINATQGEGAISVLSKQDSEKYHLSNREMLIDYISSRRAQAIITVAITRNFFGITEEERNQIQLIIDKYYYEDRVFTNFSLIGNPRVKTLTVYLQRIQPLP